MSELRIPAGVETMSLAAAALAYAGHGWYVGPVGRGKHPGSMLGKGWQNKTTLDPDLIDWWFRRAQGYGHQAPVGVFLHAGRSGAIVFDVDDPPKAPAVLLDAVLEYLPPFQSSRTDVVARGHYVFTQPGPWPDGTLGNSTGDLGPDWGEVRGTNGVVLAAPTAKATGRYRWVVGGVPPALPDALTHALLPPPPPPRRDLEPGDPFAYGSARGMLRKLLRADTGNCNKLLYWTGLRFGWLVDDGAMSRDQAAEVLTDAALLLGMDTNTNPDRGPIGPSTEYSTTIESALTRALSIPREER